jgi:hypothetical protein
MTMENENVNIEDLRDEWTLRNAKLEQMLQLNTRMLRESWLERHRADVGGTGHGVVEVLVSVPVLFLLGNFAADHVGQWRFFLPAVALHVWTVVMLATGIFQRAALRKVDYGRPVLELQRELLMLRRQRITTFKWAFLTGQVLWWIPLMIVLFKAVFGVDLFELSDFMRSFIAINLLAGLAFIPLALWLTRRYGQRLERVGALRRIVDSLAGSDMRRANAFLERLARFENEMQAAH